jgi:hypothetical protein
MMKGDSVMDDETLQLIEDCENRESRLTAWEHDFVAAIRSQVERGSELTEKQKAKLDTVWERATEKG